MFLSIWTQARHRGFVWKSDLARGDAASFEKPLPTGEISILDPIKSLYCKAICQKWILLPVQSNDSWRFKKM